MEQMETTLSLCVFLIPKVLGITASRKAFRFQRKKKGTIILLETIWGLEERSISLESSKAGLGTWQRGCHKCSLH